MKVLDILLGCHMMVRVRYCEAQENEAIRRANDGKQYRDGAFALISTKNDWQRNPRSVLKPR
jgi:hypothetical protein